LRPYGGSSGSAIGLGAGGPNAVQNDPAAAVAGGPDDQSMPEAGSGNGFDDPNAGRANAPGMRIAADRDANPGEQNAVGDSEALAPVEAFSSPVVGNRQGPASITDPLEQPAGSKLNFGPNAKVAQATPINEPMSPVQQDPPALLENSDAAQGDELYIVKANESYWDVAKRAYGAGAYFKALCEHNRRNGGAALIEPGVQLRLPDEATLQRLYPTLCPPPSRLAAASETRTASANLRADGPAYEVQEGDTLFEIARRQLGKGKRFGEIYALNRDRIGGPTDRLEPGMRLRLPASGE
jgi:nucleoid-associated protein YgaU